MYKKFLKLPKKSEKKPILGEKKRNFFTDFFQKSEKIVSKVIEKTQSVVWSRYFE